MITVEECRRILNDYQSPDELIEERIEFITSYCKNIIKSEMEKYVSKLKHEQGTGNKNKN